MNDGVYICVCNVQNVKYDLWKKHSFVYGSHYKPLHQTECCGALIDNRSDATICVLENKERAGKNMDYALQQFFEGKFHVEQVYKITPC